jgi:pimeloyl-ACP methyl ester carboxylesterase
MNNKDGQSKDIQHWQSRVGNQRDWVWRGWQIRYTYIHPQKNNSDTTPLILLHGFGASIGHWRHNIQVLGEHHTVYALDILGFGASEKASTNYSVDLWAEQIYDFWKTFIRKPIILVGNSIGSLISLNVATNYPEMVTGIIMMSLPDPSLELEVVPPALRPVVTRVKKIVSTIIASPFILKPLFKFVSQPNILRRGTTIAYGNPKAVTDELVDIIAGPPQDRGSIRALAALVKSSSSPSYSPSVKEVLPKLTVPMLLIWGQKDRIVPFVLASEFVKYNNKLELLKMDDVGHCPHDECPELVNQAILDWIQLSAEKTKLLKET